MSLTQEEIQVYSDVIANYRFQENIILSLYTLYMYYVVTTIAEEVSVMSSQRWNIGKITFIAIRYGTLASIALELTRDYRNYYVIPIVGCKVLLIVCNLISRLVIIACEVSLGLCLGAMLQAGKFVVLSILVICVGPTIVGFVFGVVSDIQYPAEPLWPLDAELGYPCYVQMYYRWARVTIGALGKEIRLYVSFCSTAALLLLAIVASIVRYRGHKGRLVRVIFRDGGMYYFSLAALQFAIALINIPAIGSINGSGGPPLEAFMGVARTVITPFLAQRLMINMRRVDYVGSEPLASRLLFAPAQSESEFEGSPEIGTIKSNPASCVEHRGGNVTESSPEGGGSSSARSTSVV